jgi:hypothetical protein
MDNFDLRKYLANNPLLNEDLIFEAVSDDEIEKAAAAALNVSVDDVPDQEPTEEEKAKVDESAILTAITIAGLIPPALNLVGSIANKAKQMFGLSDEEQAELAKLNKHIEDMEKYIENLDKKNSPKEEEERSRLEQAKKQRDEKFGTKIGNMAKHAGHGLHELYTRPIRKMLQMTHERLQEIITESLRDWFKKENWVRIDTAGNITGPCGTMKKGQATTRCLPKAKAQRLTKAERAATARKKVAGSKKGKQFVKNTPKAKVRLNK